MKWMLAMLAVCVVSGGAQDDTAQLKHILAPAKNGTMVRIGAREIARELPYPAVIHLRGDVEIRTPFCVVVSTSPKIVQYCDGYLVLHADEADFHEGTEQVDARGNVRVERTAAEH